MAKVTRKPAVRRSLEQQKADLTARLKRIEIREQLTALRNQLKKK